MEYAEFTDQPKDRVWLKYGLIGGLASALYTTVLYLVSERLIFQAWNYIPIILLLGIGVYASLTIKKRKSGFIRFGEAVATSLLTFITGYLLQTIYFLLLFLLIDPKLQRLAMTIQEEAMQQKVDAGKMTQEQMNTALSYMEGGHGNMMVFGMVIGVIFVIIIALVVYLITSAIIKKEPHS